MRILQIAPEIAPGSGVGAVAHHLETAWTRAGIEVGRFTLAEARGSWLPEPGSGLRGKVALLARVVWFSTVGTVLARRALAEDVVSVCHNDVLAGDVYVNHGILRVAMAARGNYLWRMVRNPLHLFTSLRDALRYRSHVHRVVVNLTGRERDALRRTYPRLTAGAVVISNGVDTERFQPADGEQREAARRACGIPDGATNVLFVGHEFDRKGLPLVLRAVTELPEVHVTVVGGTAEMVEALATSVAALGLSGRVHLAGQVRDPRPYLHGADVLALPSAYEANALVLLEALACGVPVVASGAGYAPELVTDGVNGFLVERTAGDVRRGLAAIVTADGAARREMSRAARESAERHGWDRIAVQYLDLLEEVAVSRRERTA